MDTWRRSAGTGLRIAAISLFALRRRSDPLERYRPPPLRDAPPDDPIPTPPPPLPSRSALLLTFAILLAIIGISLSMGMTGRASRPTQAWMTRTDMPMAPVSRSRLPRKSIPLARRRPPKPPGGITGPTRHPDRAIHSPIRPLAHSPSPRSRVSTPLRPG
jgi:hypothetical protein